MPKTIRHTPISYCSFCHKTEEQAELLFAGQDGVFICNECVLLNRELLRENSTPGTDKQAQARPNARDSRKDLFDIPFHRCPFCGELESQRTILIKSPNGSVICDECVALCQEILTEKLLAGARPVDVTPVLQMDAETEIIKAGYESKLGLKLALLRGHAYLLVKTDDASARAWDGQYITLTPMTLTSREISAPVEFSALAFFVTFWESALPGATHYCISDFFNFFDEATAAWMRAAITDDAIEIRVFVTGQERITGFIQQLGYQSLLPMYQRRLNEGLEAVAYLTELSQAYKTYPLFPLDTSASREYFQRVKMFLLSHWPDDPWKTFNSEG